MSPGSVVTFRIPSDVVLVFSELAFREGFMKTLNIAVIGIFVASCFGSPLFAEPTYPIVCRGGGDLNFNYTPSSNFSPNPQIWITFKRGAQKAGSNWENIDALMPGQCSWLERPVGSEEPNRIIVKDIGNFSISWNQGRVMGITSQLSFINWLQDPNRYQQFDVYTDSKENFILARIGQAR